jgi:transcriptional regulator with XRE-family HTH domain
MALPPTTARNAPEAGATFRALREGAGLDIRPLARRTDIDHSIISRWERGERLIGEVKYEHLSRALADYMAGVWSE